MPLIPRSRRQSLSEASTKVLNVRLVLVVQRLGTVHRSAGALMEVWHSLSILLLGICRILIPYLHRVHPTRFRSLNHELDIRLLLHHVEKIASLIHCLAERDEPVVL